MLSCELLFWKHHSNGETDIYIKNQHSTWWTREWTFNRKKCAMHWAFENVVYPQRLKCVFYVIFTILDRFIIKPIISTNWLPC